MSTPVLFLCWNRKRYSELCFERLMQMPDNVHLIVADNGSVDGTPDWITTLNGNDHITLERWLFTKNFGLFRVLNLYYSEMVKRNLSPYAGWVYNDMCPDPSWLGTLTRLLDSVPNAGMATPAFSPYRPQNSTVSMGGQNVYTNNLSYFSDGFGVMRLEVFRKRIERGEYPYIPFNNPGMSLGNFFASVQGEWLLLASQQVDQTPACAIENHGSDESYRRQDVLVKRRWACDYPSHMKATEGIVTWLQDGVEHQWLDEPAESKGHPEELWPQLEGKLTLHAALDAGGSESDINLLSA